MTYVVTWRYYADGRRVPYASQFAATSDEDAGGMCTYLHGGKEGFKILHIQRME